MAAHEWRFLSMKIVEVLGPGCNNCKRLEAVAREAVVIAGVEAEIRHVPRPRHRWQSGQRRSDPVRGRHRGVAVRFLGTAAPAPGPIGSRAASWRRGSGKQEIALT